MKASKPYVLGLTGGIASGKSHVSRYLQSLGLPVIDADAISRSLTAENGPALPLIRAAFGDGVFLPDGTLSRRALGDLVFSHAPSLDALNRLMHPLIFQEIDRRLSGLSAPIAVLEIPLLFETGAQSLCDEVWTVAVPYEMQLRRLMRRSGLSADQARRRIQSQMPTEDKKRLSDRVIDASGPYPETEAQALQFLNDIKRRLSLV